MATQVFLLIWDPVSLTVQVSWVKNDFLRDLVPGPRLIGVSWEVLANQRYSLEWVKDLVYRTKSPASRTRPSPILPPPPTRPIAPKISWTLSPLDLCPCAEFGRERSYSWRLIFRTPEAGSENIMIFSKISKYRKYQKNIMIFFIFFIFSIFSRKWKFRIGHKCNNGCNTLMQYLMTVSYQSFVPFRRILRYTFALWHEPFVCDVVAPYTQRVKIFGNILHHLIA